MAPMALTLRALWDFNHPQQWDSPGQDPHVYSWMVAVLWVTCIYFFTSIFMMEMQTRKREKIAQLLLRTERLLREKKLVEAKVCLDECKALAGFRISNTVHRK